MKYKMLEIIYKYFKYCAEITYVKSVHSNYFCE